MTPLTERVVEHVAAHMERTEGADTTVGAVAEALGVSCAAVVACAGDHYWLIVLPTDAPQAQWAIALEGE